MHINDDLGRTETAIQYFVWIFLTKEAVHRAIQKFVRIPRAAKSKAPRVSSQGFRRDNKKSFGPLFRAAQNTSTRAC
jgi:hypothetical protein